MGHTLIRSGGKCLQGRETTFELQGRADRSRARPPRCCASPPPQAAAPRPRQPRVPPAGRCPPLDGSGRPLRERQGGGARRAPALPVGGRGRRVPPGGPRGRAGGAAGAAASGLRRPPCAGRTGQRGGHRRRRRPGGAARRRAAPALPGGGCSRSRCGGGGGDGERGEAPPGRHRAPSPAHVRGRRRGRAAAGSALRWGGSAGRAWAERCPSAAPPGRAAERGGPGRCAGPGPEAAAWPGGAGGGGAPLCGPGPGHCPPCASAPGGHRGQRWPGTARDLLPRAEQRAPAAHRRTGLTRDSAPGKSLTKLTHPSVHREFMDMPWRNRGRPRPEDRPVTQCQKSGSEEAALRAGPSTHVRPQPGAQWNVKRFSYLVPKAAPQQPAPALCTQIPLWQFHGSPYQCSSDFKIKKYAFLYEEQIDGTKQRVILCKSVCLIVKNWKPLVKAAPCRNLRTALGMVRGSNWDVRLVKYRMFCGKCFAVFLNPLKESSHASQDFNSGERFLCHKSNSHSFHFGWVTDDFAGHSFSMKWRIPCPLNSSFCCTYSRRLSWLTVLIYKVWQIHQEFYTVR